MELDQILASPTSTLKARFLSKLIIPDGDSDACWGWSASVVPKGYGQIGCKELGRPVGAHRVSYKLFNGPIPEGLLVRHTCDNPPCCNPKHLLVGTLVDNVNDAVERKRNSCAKGSGSHLSKLTEDQVVELIAQGVTHRSIAKTYGCGASTVSYLRNNGWKHVPR